MRSENMKLFAIAAVLLVSMTLVIGVMAADSDDSGARDTLTVFGNSLTFGADEDGVIDVTLNGVPVRINWYDLTLSVENESVTEWFGVEFPSCGTSVEDGLFLASLMTSLKNLQEATDNQTAEEGEDSVMVSRVRVRVIAPDVYSVMVVIDGINNGNITGMDGEGILGEVTVTGIIEFLPADESDPVPVPGTEGNVTESGDVPPVDDSDPVPVPGTEGNVTESGDVPPADDSDPVLVPGTEGNVTESGDVPPVDDSDPVPVPGTEGNVTEIGDVPPAGVPDEIIPENHTEYWYTFNVTEQLSLGTLKVGDNEGSVIFGIDTNDPGVTAVNITVRDMSESIRGFFVSGGQPLALPLQVKGGNSATYRGLSCPGVVLTYPLQGNTSVGFTIEPLFINQPIMNILGLPRSDCQITLGYEAVFV
jgi:hypothetical protein